MPNQTTNLADRAEAAGESETRRCDNCAHGIFHDTRYMRDCPGMVSAHARVECRFLPTPISKAPDDWCGQFLRAEAARRGGEGR